MDEERIIKQDDPENILWRLFRLEVEKQEFTDGFLNKIVIEKGEGKNDEEE